MDLQKNKTYRAAIESYTSEGMGVAHIDRQAVFIPRAIRGEVCQVLIVKVLKNIAYGKILDWEVKSPHRVEPDCPYYGKCGGCDFRHMDYEEELEAKRLRVQDALWRVGGSEVTVEEICGAKDVLHYRNKSQYPVSAEGKVGFYRQRTHEVVEVEQCRIQSPQADAAAQALRQWLAQYHIRPYDEKTGKGSVRHLYVRLNAAGEALICVLCNGEKLPYEQELTHLLRTAVPSVVGVVLGVNTTRGNAILGEQYRTLWGQNTLLDTLCGNTYRLSVPSFYQVNHAQAEVLYSRALALAGLTGQETAVDLYCGAGTITLVLARHVKRVIGCEIVPEAIDDANENARRNGIQNAEFRCGDAKTIAAELAAEQLWPDVVCVDPPRKGLAPEVVDTVADMAPARVIYVSCDPATLARDVKRFALRGYVAQRALAVDLFPGTANVETVVLMSRVENQP
jgi:23S rRNA (uracil1939-C5)-methyltransferase